MKPWLAVSLAFAPSFPVAARGRQLLPWALPPLPVGSVTPEGWLRGELRAMADGLAGHEHDFYPYVSDSRWLGGGTDYSVLNEALPYWFNGLVPLAYVLDDARLKGQVHSVASTVLSRQGEDGWIGPEAPGSDRNFWGRTPFLLGLTQLAEANATGWHQVVVHSTVKYFRLAHRMLKNDGEGYTQCRWNPIDCSWGQVRVHDTILVIQWLLENAGLNERDEATLWDTMDMLYDMSKFKWEDWYTEDRYEKVIKDPTPGNPLFPYLHGVNVGQGLKSAAVIRRFTRRDSLINTTSNAVDWTFKYKGAPSGTILADESQRDLAPFMGSELCTAVETGYSLAYLYHALGTNSFADRAELVIFNALPTMLTHDMWAHQYMTRPNGPWALNQDGQPSLFTTANGVATVFGLEPQYPCCTVNFPQGYPKFLVNSWARADKGLAHVLLSPSTLDTTIPGIGRVLIKCETDYPFSDRLRYTVRADSAFDLYLRFPSWAVLSKSALSLSADGASAQVLRMSPDANTGLLHVSVPKGKSTVEYYIGSGGVRVEHRERADGAVSVYVGNVLYALDVGENATSTLPHRFWDTRGGGTTEFSEYEHVRDYYFNFTKPWNVAVDTSTIRYHNVNSNTGLQRAFSAHGADKETANYLSVQGCEIHWPVRGGVAPDVPPKNPRCATKKQTYRMIPFGLGKIHMSELPTVKLSRWPWESEEPGNMEIVEGADDGRVPSDL